VSWIAMANGVGDRFLADPDKVMDTVRGKRQMLRANSQDFAAWPASTAFDSTAAEAWVAMGSGCGASWPIALQQAGTNPA
jgi:hypothetical protein